MKVMHKLFVVALLLSLTLSVGAVMAQDDVTLEQSDVQAVSIETENMELDQNQDKIDDKLSATAGEDLNSPNGGGGNSLLGDIHIVDGGNFTTIQDKIKSAKAGDTIYLNGHTYKGSGQTIKVDVNNLTIVGGYVNVETLATLDAEGLSRIMEVTASNVTSDEASTFGSTLHQNSGIAHACHDTIATYEIGLIGIGLRHKLCEQSALLQHFDGCSAMSVGIYLV